MNISEISCFDIIKTLSNTRKNKEISHDFNISYSQLNVWSKEMSQAEKKTNVTPPKYHLYFLLEYFSRIDMDAVDSLMMNHNLPKDVNDIFLKNRIFDTQTLLSYMSSSIEWKSNLVDILYAQNSFILDKQIEILDIFISRKFKNCPMKTEENLYNDLKITASMAGDKLAHLTK